MRILVVSDVHANFHALRAVLDSAPEHEAIVCLGDIVGYGASPNECCETLRAQNAICLSGNHDAAIAGHDLLERMNALARISTSPFNNTTFEARTHFQPVDCAFNQTPPIQCFLEWRHF